MIMTNYCVYVEVLWVVTPCIVGVPSQHYTASQPRGPLLKSFHHCEKRRSRSYYFASMFQHRL